MDAKQMKKIASFSDDLLKGQLKAQEAKENPDQEYLEFLKEELKKRSAK